MDLYLIRHPRPVVEAGVCYGRTDLAVTEDELSAATVRLKGLLPDDCSVWSSPLIRCHQLARRLHATPRLDERLAEINFGAWERKLWDEIGQPTLDAWANNVLDFVPPGGESVRSLQSRVAEFLDHVGEEAAPLVLVTHSGVMRVAIGYLLGDNVDWMRMKFEFSTLTRVTSGKHGPELIWHNR